ncbi:MAG: chemotaxis protein [Alphaproteobacteria bacterium]|nr:MAG: chemotaxis protein [Alphaproteobacteria bacterium]
MVSDALGGQIEALVNSLRGRREASLSLAEVSGVTEILIKTMQLYFRSLDVRIYEECQNLSDYISNARKEIAALQPENVEGSRIPRAGKELDAIVRQTEEATNTIMDAAEKIMGAEGDDPEAFQAHVHEQVMRIFEACSFQDITGQRISKVVETLSYIEERANQLKNILGVDERTEPAQAEPGKSEDENLLSGPALEGEGIDQDEVDALLRQDAPEQDVPVGTDPAAPTPDAADPEEAEAQPTPTTKESAKKAEISGRSVKRNGISDKDVERLEVPEDDEGRTTQAEIDALFN